MAKIRTPSFEVSEAVFDRGIATFSGHILRQERIKRPVKWSDKWWIASSVMLSHSTNWLGMWEVVPIAQWDGQIYIFGNFDEDWIVQREKTGMFWHGCKVQIEDSPAEFIMGSRVRWTRPSSKPPTGGEGKGE